jgi:putative hydrolase of the HAD superfamily
VLLEGKPIEAVVLDAGGVLMLPDPEAFRRALAVIGLAPDDETCRRAHYVGMRELDRVGAPPWRPVDMQLALALGVGEEDLDDVIEGIERVFTHEPFVPAGGAASALARVAAAGHPFAIVSNANGTMAELLASHRICSADGECEPDVPRAVVVVDSHVVGIEKPAPAIFDFALQALGLPAERCVYLGDTVHFDVRGARAAGLHPLHIDPYSFCGDADHPHAASLTAAVEMLGLDG